MKIINPYKFGSSGGTTLTEGILSVWELDETSGTIAYDSYGSKNGSHSLSPSIGNTGLLDKCYDTSGNGYVNFSTSFYTRQTVTYSAWVKASSINVGNIQHIFGNYGRRFAIGEVGGDWYAVVYYGYNRFVYSTAATNSWTLLVGTVDDSTNTLTLYINGSYVGSRGDIGSVQYSGSSAGIGNDPYNTTREFNGLVDQCAVWDRALTSTEVSDLYNSGNGLAYINW